MSGIPELTGMFVLGFFAGFFFGASHHPVFLGKVATVGEFCDARLEYLTLQVCYSYSSFT